MFLELLGRRSRADHDPILPTLRRKKQTNNQNKKVSLLVINASLPVLATTARDNVATHLDIALVSANGSAGVILLAMLSYNTLTRPCAFDRVRRDEIALACVALLDMVAAVAWSIRLDREATFCARPRPGSSSSSSAAGPCHTALVCIGLLLAWTSVVIDGTLSAHYAAFSADHGTKKRKPPPLPISVSNRVISSPVIIHAGQFTIAENEHYADGRFGDFTNIPLRK
ncbi:hypothetical protein F5148DRAFT_1286142 [Russula earlei]|uniref:Uncharacterized protein n=1 Tax=Russula earlei TaxID=71964 RepID=A0ACC0U4Y8_9AGAM|nr:hypothetical protein F5148DRAFT_1286142 [Russula earlei]